MKINVIDLFSGVGGMSLGFKMEGFKTVIAVEKDKHIADSFKKNHKDTKVIVNDISEINIEETFNEYKGNISVVIGGPPCQGFSQKGKRKSIKDKRNFLFRYYFEVVQFLKPKYFLMENVPNLLTTENGIFKNEIIELFENIGYSLDLKILNSGEFGIPQKRRRAFVLGKLGKEKLLLPETNFKKTTIKEAISDLAYLESGEGSFEQEYHIKEQTSYQSFMRKNSTKLYNHIATNHSNVALERLRAIPPGKGREVLPKEHQTKSIFSGTWCRMIEDALSVTITTRFDTPSSGRFTHPRLNRAITVREAARIQSFPDDFIFYNSKTSQMKQVGNAVPPLLAKEIAATIKKDISHK